MSKYVDGFVLVVPKKKVGAYRNIASKAGKIWRKYGALDYKECIGDDLNIKMGIPFPKLAKSKKDETIVFSYIVYKSREHRNQVNSKVMKDKQIKEMCKNMPFDCKKMSWGGFKVLVDAK